MERVVNLNRDKLTNNELELFQGIVPDHCTVRDPARIPRILDKLKEIWVKYPDLRFTQLLILIGINEHEVNCSIKCNFAKEDDHISTLLDKEINNVRSYHE